MWCLSKFIFPCIFVVKSIKTNGYDGYLKVDMSKFFFLRQKQKNYKVSDIEYRELKRLTEKLNIFSSYEHSRSPFINYHKTVVFFLFIPIWFESNPLISI